MGSIWGRLPGPFVAKLAVMVIVIVLVLLGLVVLFEWAGDLLDSGGAVG